MAVGTGAVSFEGAAAQAEAPFPLHAGERIVVIGNTFAERMQLFPHFEAMATALHPEDSLTFRNLGWSGDEVDLRPRPLNFGDLHTHLAEQRADVILAAFGMNESFDGPEGLPEFRADLRELLEGLLEQRFNEGSPPRIVLLSPIAHERVASVPLDPTEHNRSLAMYTEAMREVATETGVRFVDLYTPTARLMADPALGDLTINGIHLNDRGYEVAARLIAGSLGWVDGDPLKADVPIGSRYGGLREAIRAKNELFFLRWRAVNGEYIYGRRKEPFGVVDFPPEMERMEGMIRDREREIWKMAQTLGGKQQS